MDRMRSEAETHAAAGRATSHLEMHAGGRAPEDEGSGGLGARLRQSIGDRLPRGTMLDAVRARPLTAVGLVFSAGFLLAVTTRSKRRPAFLDRARSRIRTVLLTGLTAAVAQELRSIVSEEDLSDLFAAWTGHDDEDPLDGEL